MHWSLWILFGIFEISCIFLAMFFLYELGKTILLRFSLSKIFQRKFQFNKNEYSFFQGKISTNDNTLLSPLSQEPCVYYKTKINFYKSKRHQKSIVDKEEMIPFYVDTEIGRFDFLSCAPLNESQYRFHVSQNKQDISVFSKASQTMKNILSNIQISASNFEDFTSMLSVYETRLILDKDIFLLAYPGEKQPDGSYNFTGKSENAIVYLAETRIGISELVTDHLLDSFSYFISLIVIAALTAYVVFL